MSLSKSLQIRQLVWLVPLFMIMGALVSGVVGALFTSSEAAGIAPIVEPPLRVIVQKRCDTADVQKAVILYARPNMGPLEVEFWQKAIAAAALKANLPAAVVTAKIAEESTFHGRAISNKGAKGASQLMPIWTKDFDPFEIEANLNRGAEVLAKELEQTDGDMFRALRRYNGGAKGERIKSTEAYAWEILARVYLARQKVCYSNTAS